MLPFNSGDLALSANLCFIITLLAKTHTAFQLPYQINTRLTILSGVRLSIIHYPLQTISLNTTPQASEENIFRRLPFFLFFHHGILGMDRLRLDLIYRDMLYNIHGLLITVSDRHSRDRVFFGPFSNARYNSVAPSFFVEINPDLQPFVHSIIRSLNRVRKI